MAGFFAMAPARSRFAGDHVPLEPLLDVPRPSMNNLIFGDVTSGSAVDLRGLPCYVHQLLHGRSQRSALRLSHHTLPFWRCSAGSIRLEPCPDYRRYAHRLTKPVDAPARNEVTKPALHITKPSSVSLVQIHSTCWCVCRAKHPQLGHQVKPRPWKRRRRQPGVGQGVEFVGPAGEELRDQGGLAG